MRKRLYQIIESSNGTGILGNIYDGLMIVVIIASLVPLAFKADHEAFVMIDNIAVGILIIDYLLRLLTADYKYRKKSISSFARYPFSFFAIIDLISILPSLTVLSSSFKLLRLLRMIRALRVFHVFKAFRYSKSMNVIITVFKKQRTALVAVGTLTIGYILVSALIIFNAEPDLFPSFLNAVYWATVSLTTLGHSNISPATALGQIVTMISSVIGIAVVALPAGIITAGYITEISEEKTDPGEGKFKGE
ncbi:MAG: ion transporter [Dehalococcoidia bacterium]|nr:ion transporter [Dehalococcoidia bacterium]